MDNREQNSEQNYLESWLKIEKEAESIKENYLGVNRQKKNQIGNLERTIHSRRKFIDRASQKQLKQTKPALNSNKAAPRLPKPPKFRLNKSKEEENIFLKKKDSSATEIYQTRVISYKPGINC